MARRRTLNPFETKMAPFTAWDIILVISLSCRLDPSVFYRRQFRSAFTVIRLFKRDSYGPYRARRQRPTCATVTLENNTALNGFVYFVANSTSGRTLWKSDGTDAGTMVVDTRGIFSTPSQLTIVGNEVFFRAFASLSTSVKNYGRAMERRQEPNWFET